MAGDTAAWLQAGILRLADPRGSPNPTPAGVPACEGRPASLIQPHKLRSLAMTAIYTVLAFLVVVGALNVFEFGRLD